MAGLHIRKGDLVEVIAGDDADGRARRVLRVLTKERKVVIEGVNRVYKHLKQRQARQAMQGGRLSREMPICISNVLLYCQSCKRGVRIGRRYGPDGRKERACKKCGASLGALSGAREAYAQK